MCHKIIQIFTTFLLLFTLTSCKEPKGVPYGDNYREYFCTYSPTSSTRVLAEFGRYGQSFDKITIYEYEFIEREALFVEDSKINSENLRYICNLLYINSHFIDNEEFYFIDGYYTYVKMKNYHLPEPKVIEIKNNGKVCVPSLICNVLNYKINYIEYDKGGNIVKDGILNAFYVTSLDGIIEVKYY